MNPQIGDLYSVKSDSGYQRWELILLVIDKDKQICLSDTDKNKYANNAGQLVSVRLYDTGSLEALGYEVKKLS